VIFEAIARVVLEPSHGEPSTASSPESYGFIITLGAESFSSAVIPNGSGHLVPGQEAEVRLHFLAPQAASKAINPGSKFTFFECHRKGYGHVLSVNCA